MQAYVNTPNKGTLNMRAEPNKTSKILTTIPYKASVEAEYVNNTWSKIIYNGQTGYVMTEFLSNGKAVTRSDLEQIYNSLKSTLETIEKVLK